MRLSNVRLALQVCFLCTGWCCTSSAAPVVTGITLVSQKRISRTVSEYTYQALVVNDGAAVREAVGQLVAVGAGTVIIDAQLTIGSLAANFSANTADTFSIRHDRRLPFNRAALKWSMSWKLAAAAETVTATTTDSVGPEGGAIELPGIVEVTFTEDPQRAPSLIDVQKLISPDLLGAFASSRPDDGPALPEIFRIHSTERFNTPISICVDVPLAFLVSIPADKRVELFAEFVQSSNMETPYTTFERLGASFDSQTHRACSTLPPYAFMPVASVVANVIVGAYANVSAASEATASGFVPAGERLTGPNETISVSGNLSIAVPPVLASPLGGALTVPNGGAFGQRVDPFTGQPSFHKGVDLSADHVAVLAAALGTVTKSGAQSPCYTWVNGVCMYGYGHRVTISHQGASGNSETRYGHLVPQGLAALGQIAALAPVGTADNTGSSTAPHLHFEYRPSGNAVNPMLFIGIVKEAEFLSSISVVTKVDGLPVATSRKVVPSKDFQYLADIDLTPLALQPGNHALVIALENMAGQSTVVHSATLRVGQPSSCQPVPPGDTCNVYRVDRFRANNATATRTWVWWDSNNAGGRPPDTVDPPRAVAVNEPITPVHICKAGTVWLPKQRTVSASTSRTNPPDTSCQVNTGGAAHAMSGPGLSVSCESSSSVTVGITEAGRLNVTRSFASRDEVPYAAEYAPYPCGGSNDTLKDGTVTWDLATGVGSVRDTLDVDIRIQLTWGYNYGCANITREAIAHDAIGGDWDIAGDALPPAGVTFVRTIAAGQPLPPECTSAAD